MGWICLAVGLIAVAAGVSGLIRLRAAHAGHLRLAFAGACSSLLASGLLVAWDQRVLTDTPLLAVMFFSLSEWALALLTLWRISGRPSPRWLL
jgi:hypothetical protein